MTTAPIRVPWLGEPYTRSAAVLSFALLGLPQPQGSKSFRGFSNSGKAIMTEAVKGLKPWRAEVQKAIKHAIACVPVVPAGGFPLLGPIAIDLVFTMRKPTSAPKTRVTYPIVKPDIDKLARAVLDAGTLAGLWGDDSQVIDLHPYKVYPREAPGALRAPGLVATVHLIGPPPVERGEQLVLEGK